MSERKLWTARRFYLTGAAVFAALILVFPWLLVASSKYAQWVFSFR